MWKFKVSNVLPVCLYLFTYLSTCIYLHLLFSFLVPQPLLVLDPSDTIITLGTTVTLTCTVSVIDSLSGTVTAFTWYRDSTVISEGVTNNLNQGQSRLSLDTISSNEAGNYTCAAQISSPYIDDGSVIMISNSTNITVQCKLALHRFIILHRSSHLSNVSFSFH